MKIFELLNLCEDPFGDAAPTAPITPQVAAPQAIQPQAAVQQPTVPSKTRSRSPRG